MLDKAQLQSDLANPPTNDPAVWEEKVGELRETAVKVVLKHLGPIRITPTHNDLRDNPAVLLRDSIIYRAGALGYHVNLLRQQRYAYLLRAQQRTGGRPVQELLLSARRFLTYLTDDILFNSTSLLDYTANLVGYVATNRASPKLKWNGVIRSVRDPGNSVSKSAAARLMQSLHVEWIDGLHEIRSDIIHEKHILGDARMETVFNLAETKLISGLFFPLAPKAIRRLPFLRPADGDTDIDLVEGMEQVAARCLDAASQIMRQLLDDIGGPIQVKQTEPEIVGDAAPNTPS